MLQIFIPGCQVGIAKAALDSIGLESLLIEGESNPSVTMFNGADSHPDFVSQRGVLLTFPSENIEDEGANPIQPGRDWIAWPESTEGDSESSAEWYASVNGAIPEPREVRVLSRNLESSPVKLAGGEYWFIPNVPNLPQVVKISKETLRPFLETKEEYLDIVTRSIVVRDTFLEIIGSPLSSGTEKEQREVPVEDIYSLAIDLLMMNYRLTPHLISMWKLLDTECVFNVVLSAAHLSAEGLSAVKTGDENIRLCFIQPETAGA